MKAHPEGFMTLEVKELIEGARRVRKDLEDFRGNAPHYWAGRVEVDGTISVLERALEELNRLADNYGKATGR